jgi:hypothetical protein
VGHQADQADPAERGLVRELGCAARRHAEAAHPGVDLQVGFDPAIARARDRDQGREIFFAADHRREIARDDLVLAGDLRWPEYEDLPGHAGLAQRDALLDQADREPAGRPGLREGLGDRDRAVAVAVRLHDRVDPGAGDRAHQARVGDDGREVDFDPRTPDHRRRRHDQI